MPAWGTPARPCTGTCMKTVPLSRAREASRRASEARTRWRGAMRMTSKDPISAATTVAQRSAGGSSITTRRSNGKPASAAADHPDTAPTDATQEPAMAGPAAMASAREVAPLPETPTVVPRCSAPPGSKGASGSRTASTCSCASDTGRGCARDIGIAAPIPPVSNNCSLKATRGPAAT